jgi:hypothetical protein
MDKQKVEAKVSACLSNHYPITGGIDDEELIDI